MRDSGVTFDAMIEAEVLRANDEADDALLSARRAHWCVGAAKLVSILAFGSAWALWPAWWALGLGAVAVIATVAEGRLETQRDRHRRASWLATGRISGLVAAATHPSRRDTLLVRVPFAGMRSEVAGRERPN